jgi:hypothetical protein
MSANDQVHVCNCISGTGIGNIFQNEDKPVLNSYDVIQLEKISLQIWIPFISARFANTGKSIDNAAAEMILQLTENHPQLVQVLGQQAWLRTPFICNEKIVAEAHESLLMANNLLFRNITDNLSNTQLYFLKALIKGEKHFNSQKVILNYKLGTSGNISKIKKGLTDKRILEINDIQIQFLDPIYKAWLEKLYFKIF